MLNTMALLGPVLSLALSPPVPPVPVDVDLWRFPPEEVCRAATDFLAVRQAHLLAAAQFDCGHHTDADYSYDEALYQVQECSRAWWLLRSASDRDNTERCRREALDEIRRRIGEDDWWAGRMPCPAWVGLPP